MTSEKTFLLFHGWGISPYLYKKIIKELLKKGRVISPKINFLNYKDQLPLINKEIQGKVIVIGHSAGAIVAMEFAKNYPQKTEKIILLAPAGFTTSWSFFGWVNKWIAHILRLVINPGPFIPALIVDFVKTTLIHPVIRIREAKKISKIGIHTIPGLKVLAIFAKNDDIIHLPKVLNNVEFEVVEGDHYFFLRKPELLMRKI